MLQPGNKGLLGTIPSNISFSVLRYEGGNSYLICSNFPCTRAHFSNICGHDDLELKKVQLPVEAFGFWTMHSGCIFLPACWIPYEVCLCMQPLTPLLSQLLHLYLQR